MIVERCRKALRALFQMDPASRETDVLLASGRGEPFQALHPFTACEISVSHHTQRKDSPYVRIPFLNTPDSTTSLPTRNSACLESIPEQDYQRRKERESIILDANHLSL